MRSSAFIYLSVCLLAGLRQNYFMDRDKFLSTNRSSATEHLIKFSLTSVHSFGVNFIYLSVSLLAGYTSKTENGHLFSLEKTELLLKG